MTNVIDDEPLTEEFLRSTGFPPVEAAAHAAADAAYRAGLGAVGAVEAMEAARSKANAEVAEAR